MTVRVEYADDDSFHISLRGACLVAATEYEKTFGKEESGDSSVEISEQMFKRINGGTP